MKHLLFSCLLLLMFANAKSQAVSFTLTQAPCNLDGILTANVVGMIPPLTFTWNGGGMGTIIHTGVMSTSDVLNFYSGGPIYCSVTASGSQTGGYYNGAPPFTFTVSSTPANCPLPGTLTTTVTGGSTPYTFAYSEIPSGAIVSTSNPASLPGGAYNVTITDNAGCVYGSLYSLDSVEIGQPPIFTINTSQTLANCTNGSITVNSIIGGIPTYSYLWSTGSTSNAITGLSAGPYNLTVTDGNGCHQTSNYYVSQAININAPITTTNANCLNNDGAVIAFGSGGTPPYSYLWSTGHTTQSVTSLPSGPYQVVVTDVNNCTGQGSTYLGSSTPIVATYSTTASQCTSPTGSASLTVTGGSGPYTITWSTFPIQTGLTASNLAPGNYGFHIEDASGCIQDGIVTIPPVSIFSVSLNTSPASCLSSNGSITANITGGASPFTYSWTGGGSTATLSSKPAGSYGVTVTDNLGCVQTKSGTINSSTPLTIGLSSTPASCIFANDGSINATVTGGTGPYTWSGLGSSPSGLSAGYYSFNVSDANGCTQSAWTNLGYNPSGTSCYCTISGTVYEDLNSNCVQDPGEAGIPNIQIHVSTRGYTYTDASGHYSMKVPSGSYTVSETVLTLYPLASCQNNAIVVNAVASSGCLNTVNFANVVNPLHDVKINTWNLTNAVPGFPHTQMLLITNMGSVTENTVHGGYTTDGQLGVATAVPALPFINTSGNWFSTTSTSGTSLAPGASTFNNFEFNVPANIPLATNVFCNDTTANTTNMNDWLNDYSPWDNVQQGVTTIVGPYDPNFKEVSPKGLGNDGQILTKDSVLDYMIHFQNLGTYKAQNIVILDTLDSDLDWTSLRPVHSSHACTVSINENGVAKFEFKNINLPAKSSFNESLSQGHTSYTIKTKKGLPYGTQFKNSASIYFDFNAPIHTNTTVNTLVQVLAVSNTNLEAGVLNIYPNPANDILNVDFSMKNGTQQQVAISIVDISGKEVYRSNQVINTNKQHLQINTSTLASGSYFISIKNNSFIQTAKFIKMN